MSPGSLERRDIQGKEGLAEKSLYDKISRNSGEERMIDLGLMSWAPAPN